MRNALVKFNFALTFMKTRGDVGEFSMRCVFLQSLSYILSHCHLLCPPTCYEYTSAPNQDDPMRLSHVP